MRQWLFLACLIIAPITGAQAGSRSCYDSGDLEAEMIVRLHSELMVVTLACRTSSTGIPLPPSYTGFTQKYLQWIKSAESRLMAWYRKNGSKGPQAKLDLLRTDMGNAYSQELADLSPGGFCGKYRDITAKAAHWSREDVRSKLSILSAAYPSRAPLCKPKHQARLAE